jgi:hypothetical protein
LDTFFLGQVGASAALVGLIFVGASINLDKIMEDPHLPGRVLEALVVLVAVLIVSSLGLVSGQPVAVPVGAIVLAGLAGWGLIVVGLVHHGRSPHQSRFQFAARVVLGQLATLPYVVGGASLLVGLPGGPYWLVLAILASYVLAVSSAWVLLIEINR